MNLPDKKHPDQDAPVTPIAPHPRDFISPVILGCDPETFLGLMVEAFGLSGPYAAFAAAFDDPVVQD
ncbi:hypothetical protein A2856_01035 [Candidatus Uhrbacteria bacterium RIFCSPHIGHO2_01_FULL_63_20]|uniref:Uncharacterized protein n=1 Tax=Candidatus Uhrbacteria bacterium RIFCSPHIGHO2_01_FULL_63_20 TaxID=1802385 RepID=A0A1F7TM48_9BACT|nr:MAG: hypothetical protein A2856_01035 [Candidatus Uhrbacteria bacterium RIFCSPHIGHO2_01_FULL_63_20]